ncbi:MAG: ROK family protein [Candidatus Bathyarchaeota archaeon]|nr:ROK family protein [Candidatus Bathyarchaeota archaeon]
MGRLVASPLTIGVDLGGTKIETAVVDAQGRIVSGQKYPTESQRKTAEEIIVDLLACVDKSLDVSPGKVKALGVGVAGQVDFVGCVRSAPNLGWRNVELKTKLQRKLRMPVVVTNDVRAATWGEWQYGAGKGVEDLVVVFVGTGIGGGIISGGKVMAGCSNMGGDLGHTTVVAEGRKCHCRNRGCLEAYAGGWAIAERAQEAIRVNIEAGQRLVSLSGGIETVTAATVSQAYKKGDPLAHELICETAEYLAAGLTGIVNAFNPCILVLGGGVIEGTPKLIEMAEGIIEKRALEPAVENLKVVKATLGGNAGVVGAAALAQEAIERTP